ncbi:MAG: PIN domain-containing protein [Chloroflexi bacterium]|nr:PIN domain-containing protein [Chloroflexota bacterium]
MAYLIDTSIWIRLERDRKRPRDVRELIPGESFALAAITASEILVGVHKAKSPDQRIRRQRFVETILQIAPVEEFDLPVARVHAELAAELDENGIAIGSHDLLIAATARAKGYVVLTHNPREFKRVPGLEVRAV